MPCSSTSRSHARRLCSASRRNRESRCPHTSSSRVGPAASTMATSETQERERGEARTGRHPPQGAEPAPRNGTGPDLPPSEPGSRCPPLPSKHGSQLRPRDLLGLHQSQRAAPGGLASHWSLLTPITTPELKSRILLAAPPSPAFQPVRPAAVRADEQSGANFERASVDVANRKAEQRGGRGGDRLALP